MVMRLSFFMFLGSLLTANCGVAQSATWNDYLITKKVVETYSAKKKIYDPARDGELGGRCNDFTSMLWSGEFGSATDHALADIAGKIVFWSNELTALGYPPSISKDLTGQIEHDLVSNLLSGHYHKEGNFYDIDFGTYVDRLITTGNAYRKRNNPNLKRLYQEQTGCGAGGEADVSFASSPSGGQISIIPEFNYELCKAKGDTSISGCTAWRRINSTGNSGAISVYYVYVTWPGKTFGPTRYDLSRVKGGQKIVVGE
jgi:hypothetical protein